jgi:haloacetate dehalogenase
MDTSLHAALFPGFRQTRLAVRDATAGTIEIPATIGGKGPPVLLLHGHPQTRATWHRVAPALAAAGYTVVATDLRGYGDASKPEGGPGHINYSKRQMAADQAAVMAQLGFAKYAVVGHDRGARVTHRLCLDHAAHITKAVVLDTVPTAAMYARTDKEFATKLFWWFFLIQPADLPERLIGSDPAYFLRRHINGQLRIDGSCDERVFADYLRCYQVPGTIRAICEDYRAGATIDLDHDKADASAKVTAPLLALWGGRHLVGGFFDVLATWREKAVDVRGRALDCGHTAQEEAPEALMAELVGFLGG